MAWGAVLAAAGTVYQGYKEKRTREKDIRSNERAQKKDAKANAEYLAYLRSSRLANATSPLKAIGMDTGGLFTGSTSFLLIGVALFAVFFLLSRR